MDRPSTDAPIEHHVGAAPGPVGVSRRGLLLGSSALTLVIAAGTEVETRGMPFDDGTWFDDGTGWVD